jgi:hypothetical protein
MDTLLTAQSTPQQQARGLPTALPRVFMQWRNLLLAHWPIRAALLRALIPRELEIDTFDGSAWIGIVPFYLTIRYRGMPFSLSFPEVNVRTYVRHRDLSGVWFLSLDAHNRLAVATARNHFGLPYHFARMSMQSKTHNGQQRLCFASERKSKRNGRANLRLDYGPSGEAYPSRPGTLEYWLTERYRLFAVNRYGQIGIGEIDHAPWRLQPATADFEINSMLAPLGLSAPMAKPLLHFSRRIDAIAWAVEWATLHA